jgi:excinuclease ABC subunit C
MLTTTGELLYVGKAKCLRSRLLSYFRPRSRDPKAGQIIRHTRAIVWEQAGSEFAALLRELELIRRWRPPFNVHGQPARRRPIYVCLGGRPAPHAYLTPRPSAAAVCFGPVPAGRRAREAVRHLNDCFRLRDCPRPQTMIFAGEAELFPTVRAAGCLRYEIGTCLGPCLGACSRGDYMRSIRSAQAFLECQDETLLGILERNMQAASAALAFERAAALLEKLEALRWLRDRLAHLRRARERQSFIYPVREAADVNRWYLIHGGVVKSSLREPRTAAEGEAAALVLRETYATHSSGRGPAAAGEVDALLLVAGWFKRHPEERTRLLSPSVALAHGIG